MRLSSFIFIILGIISCLSSTHAQSLNSSKRQKEYGIKFLPLPAELSEENIFPALVYLDHHDNEKCYGNFLKDTLRNITAEKISSTSNEILEVLKILKFNPSCYWQTTLNKAMNEKHLVLGFTTGNVVEASFGLGLPFILDLASIGFEKGLELSIVRYGQDRLMIGFVKSGGVDLNAVALPVGLSPIQGIIRGQCEHGINSYLGSFLSGELAASNHSIGFNEKHFFQRAIQELTNFALASGFNEYELTESLKSSSAHSQILSGCNSFTSIMGATAALLGTSYTYYVPASQFVIVEGPRIQPLLNFLDQINQNKLQ